MVELQQKLPTSCHPGESLAKKNQSLDDGGSAFVSGVLAAPFHDHSKEQASVPAFLLGTDAAAHALIPGTPQPIACELTGAEVPACSLTVP